MASKTAIPAWHPQSRVPTAAGLSGLACGKATSRSRLSSTSVDSQRSGRSPRGHAGSGLSSSSLEDALQQAAAAACRGASADAAAATAKERPASGRGPLSARDYVACTSLDTTQLTSAPPPACASVKSTRSSTSESMSRSSSSRAVSRSLEKSTAASRARDEAIAYNALVTQGESSWQLRAHRPPPQAGQQHMLQIQMQREQQQRQYQQQQHMQQLHLQSHQRLAAACAAGRRAPSQQSQSPRQAKQHAPGRSPGQSEPKTNRSRRRDSDHSVESLRGALKTRSEAGCQQPSPGEASAELVRQLREQDVRRRYKEPSDVTIVTVATTETKHLHMQSAEQVQPPPAAQAPQEVALNRRWDAALSESSVQLPERIVVVRHMDVPQAFDNSLPSTVADPQPGGELSAESEASQDEVVDLESVLEDTQCQMAPESETPPQQPQPLPLQQQQQQQQSQQVQKYPHQPSQPQQEPEPQPQCWTSPRPAGSTASEETIQALLDLREREQQQPASNLQLLADLSHTGHSRDFPGDDVVIRCHGNQRCITDPAADVPPAAPGAQPGFRNCGTPTTVLLALTPAKPSCASSRASSEGRSTSVAAEQNCLGSSTGDSSGSALYGRFGHAVEVSMESPPMSARPIGGYGGPMRGPLNFPPPASGSYQENGRRQPAPSWPVQPLVAAGRAGQSYYVDGIALSQGGAGKSQGVDEQRCGIGPAAPASPQPSEASLAAGLRQLQDLPSQQLQKLPAQALQQQLQHFVTEGSTSTSAGSSVHVPTSLLGTSCTQLMPTPSDVAEAYAPVAAAGLRGRDAPMVTLVDAGVQALESPSRINPCSSSSSSCSRPPPRRVSKGVETDFVLGSCASSRGSPRSPRQHTPRTESIWGASRRESEAASPMVRGAGVANAAALSEFEAIAAVVAKIEGQIAAAREFVSSSGKGQEGGCLSWDVGPSPWELEAQLMDVLRRHMAALANENMALRAQLEATALSAAAAAGDGAFGMHDSRFSVGDLSARSRTSIASSSWNRVAAVAASVAPPLETVHSARMVPGSSRRPARSSDCQSRSRSASPAHAPPQQREGCASPAAPSKPHSRESHDMELRQLKDMQNELIGLLESWSHKTQPAADSSVEVASCFGLGATAAGEAQQHASSSSKGGGGGARASSPPRLQAATTPASMAESSVFSPRWGASDEGDPRKPRCETEPCFSFNWGDAPSPKERTQRPSLCWPSGPPPVLLQNSGGRSARHLRQRRTWHPANDRPLPAAPVATASGGLAAAVPAASGGVASSSSSSVAAATGPVPLWVSTRPAVPARATVHGTASHDAVVRAAAAAALAEAAKLVSGGGDFPREMVSSQSLPQLAASVVATTSLVSAPPLATCSSGGGASLLQVASRPASPPRQPSPPIRIQFAPPPCVSASRPFRTSMIRTSSLRGLSAR
eukprot:TRINITY_DN9939_c0_g1_i1.p1 TRINITY_DN9939_c0_g1~~TRINITY_DN9939_c0_g1_i1.p1  ORF type:complete len:1446 (-),score=272.13 TRINITY_DN9939_c0_g1_i1:105-4376(-)